MTNSNTRTTQTRLAARHGPTGNQRPLSPKERSTIFGAASLIIGAHGAVLAIIPGLGVIALVVAAVAFAVGVTAMRAGSEGDRRKYARFGIVLSLAALVLGVINVAIQAELFSYFTAR